jgi:hypothetical protein
LLSLLLAGCCTSLGPPETGRVDGQEWGDTSLCGIFSGWGTAVQPDRSYALYTPVTSSEFTRRLCKHVDVEDYATCANRIEDVYRDSVDDPGSPGSSTSGPFAVVLAGDVLVGNYRSDPFSASFRVSSSSNSCAGSYNAIYGDKEPAFDVWCDDGRRGTARIVRDRHGRNGIGVVQMDDGTQGSIVFGRDVARAARSAL